MPKYIPQHHIIEFPQLKFRTRSLMYICTSFCKHFFYPHAFYMPRPYHPLYLITLRQF
jgi:hypothetical protein